MTLYLANRRQNRHARCVLFAIKKFRSGFYFVIKYPSRLNLRSYKIWKIPNLYNFHSLYQLLHSQEYRNGLKLCSVKSVQIRSYFWSVFSCIQSEYRKIRTRNNSVSGHISRSVNEGESNEICENIYRQKFTNDTQKSLTLWFNQKKNLMHCVKKRCVRGR